MNANSNLNINLDLFKNNIPIDTLTGREVNGGGKIAIVAPEGYGKSSHIIKNAVKNNHTSFCIFHTNKNTEEKYNKFSQQSNENNRVMIVKSRCGIMSDWIEYHNKSLFDYFSECKCHSQSINYLYQIRAFSIHSTGKIEYLKEFENSEIYNKTKVKNKTNASLNSFGEEQFNKMFKFINSKIKSNKIYKSVFFVIQKKENIDDEWKFVSSSVVKEYIEFAKNGKYIEANSLLKNYDSEGFHATVQSLMKLKHSLKINSENISKIKEYIDGHKKCCVFVQEKTFNKYLESHLKKCKSKKNTQIIIDEICEHHIKNISLNDIQEYTSTLTDYNGHNSDDILIRDMFTADTISQSIDLKNKIINKTVNIKKNIQIRNLGKHGIDVSIGKCHLADMFTISPNTTVLTSEYLMSSILKFYGYTVYEIEKGKISYEYPIQLNVSCKKDKIQLRSSVEKEIDAFCEMANTNRNDLGDKYLSLGTRKFGTDFSIEACKGRNFDEKYVTDIIVNSSHNKFALSMIRIFTDLLERPLTESEQNIIKVIYKVDLLNQAIGRVSGHRSEQHPFSITRLFVHHSDSIVLEAIKNIRYWTIETDFNTSRTMKFDEYKKEVDDFKMHEFQGDLKKNYDAICKVYDDFVQEQKNKKEQEQLLLNRIKSAKDCIRIKSNKSLNTFLECVKKAEAATPFSCEYIEVMNPKASKYKNMTSKEYHEYAKKNGFHKPFNEKLKNIYFKANLHNLSGCCYTTATGNFIEEIDCIVAKISKNKTALVSHEIIEFIQSLYNLHYFTQFQCSMLCSHLTDESINSVSEITYDNLSRRRPDDDEVIEATTESITYRQYLGNIYETSKNGNALDSFSHLGSTTCIEREYNNRKYHQTIVEDHKNNVCYFDYTGINKINQFNNPENHVIYDNCWKDRGWRIF